MVVIVIPVNVTVVWQDDGDLTAKISAAKTVNARTAIESAVPAIAALTDTGVRCALNHAVFTVRFSAIEIMASAQHVTQATGMIHADGNARTRAMVHAKRTLAFAIRAQLELGVTFAISLATVIATELPDYVLHAQMAFGD